MVSKLLKILILSIVVYSQHSPLVAGIEGQSKSIWNQQKTLVGKVFMVSSSTDNQRVRFTLTQTSPSGQLKEHMLEFCHSKQQTGFDSTEHLRDRRLKTLQNAMSRRSEIRVSFPDTFNRHCVDSIESRSKVVNI